MFSAALQSGELAPLVREFELGNLNISIFFSYASRVCEILFFINKLTFIGDEAVTAAANGDMEAFVKALQKKKDQKDTEEEMALD